MFAGSLSGPLTKKSSFSLDVEHRGIDEDAVINATVLDSHLRPAQLSESVLTPQGRWNVVPRLDLQLSDRNTLTARYAFSRVGNDNQGVGSFSLPSRAFDVRDTEHTAASQCVIVQRKKYRPGAFLP